MAVATNEAITKALQSLLKRKGVVGYVILDKAGVPVQSNFEIALAVLLSVGCCGMQPGLAQTYAGLVPPLVYLADDMVRDTDPEDEMRFLRVRSTKQEIMVSAHPDFTLAVVQSTGAQPAGN